MTVNVTRDRLRQLVDDLPESQWSSAERALSYLLLLANATPDDEAWSVDDETAIQEAEAEIADGAFLTHDEARRQLLERQ